MLAKTLPKCQNESGPGGATNAITGPRHATPSGEVPAMSFDGHYTDSPTPIKVEQSAILSPDDIRRCRMIAERELGIVRQIASAVAEQTDVPFKAIMGVRRDTRTVQARQLVMYIARRQGLSLARIGYAMCRDHTTILHGIRAEEKRRGER
jgi:hypothetical protein